MVSIGGLPVTESRRLSATGAEHAAQSRRASIAARAAIASIGLRRDARAAAVHQTAKAHTQAGVAGRAARAHVAARPAIVRIDQLKYAAPAARDAARGARTRASRTRDAARAGRSAGAAVRGVDRRVDASAATRRHSRGAHADARSTRLRAGAHDAATPAVGEAAARVDADTAAARQSSGTRARLTASADTGDAIAAQGTDATVIRIGQQVDAASCARCQSGTTGGIDGPRVDRVIGLRIGHAVRDARVVDRARVVRRIQTLDRRMQEQAASARGARHHDKHQKRGGAAAHTESISRLPRSFVPVCKRGSVPFQARALRHGVQRNA